jgi:hypothetical protein
VKGNAECREFRKGLRDHAVNLHEAHR